MSYSDFLAGKAQKNTGHGFAPLVMPDHLFDFQRELVGWAVEQGRGDLWTQIRPRADHAREHWKKVA